ncbi:YggT family protein [Pseudonocardia abyssalis]|uniref:YggT family protein n=1 Tax=Pseudonocardia abyssalis TaxID=2792008 RepID=A0ABS6ULT2_9PSEU|nr:YggT family protein [Pseudonocardia abyssalis]MBW0118922.1 YggT family protein [Pseudonocardia abyssalis]MBW0133203.1 YggT family protein [Pseudonocardia abyssalis]
MTVIGVLLGTLLLIFQVALFARLVVDWAGVLAGGPEPGWRRGARRATHAVTEPVLAPVRRVLRPVRIGSVGLDLAFPVVFLAVVLLRQLVLTL